MHLAVVVSASYTRSHVVANFKVATTGREGIVSFCASLRNAHPVFG